MRTLHPFLLLVLFGLSACINIGGKSPETSYYLLPVLAETSPGAHGRTAAKVQVRIAPVVVAAYLDRAQIVFRKDSQLSMADFARWGEPLQDGVARVVGSDLERLRPGLRSVSSQADLGLSGLQLNLEVRRFDGAPGHPVSVEVRWRLSERKTLAEGEYVRELTPEGEDYAGVVKALGTGLAELSLEISRQLAVAEL